MRSASECSGWRGSPWRTCRRQGSHPTVALPAAQSFAQSGELVAKELGQIGDGKPAQGGVAAFAGRVGYLDQLTLDRMPRRRRKHPKTLNRSHPSTVSPFPFPDPRDTRAARVGGHADERLSRQFFSRGPPNEQLRDVSQFSVGVLACLG